MKPEILGIYQDPTDSYEEVKEYTPEEVYYNTEGDVPKHCEHYIVHLERKLKSLKDAVKELHDEIEVHDKLTYYKNKLWKIFKS
jgi:hypothetical protein